MNLKKLFPELELFDTAVVLAFTTSYLYFVTYFYEQSYCSTFKIPSSFISINFDTMLAFYSNIFTLIFYVIAPGFIIWFYFGKAAKKSLVINRIVVFNIIIICSFILTYNIILIPNSGIYILIAIYLIIIIISLILLWKLPRIAHSSEKVNESMTVNDAILWFKKIIRRGVLFFLSGGLIAANFLGREDAHKQVNFLVLKSSPQRIVIRNYADKLICKDYDEKKRNIGDTIIIIKIADSAPLVLIQRQLHTDSNLY